MRFVVRLAPLMVVAMMEEIPDFPLLATQIKGREFLVAFQDENLLLCLTGTTYYYLEAHFIIIYNTLLDIKSLH